MKSAVIAQVYEKSLNLSVGARSKYATGEITNIMSVDSHKLQGVCLELCLVVSAPIQILVALVLLGRTIGVACIGGLIVLLIMVPLTVYTANRTKFYQVICG